MLLPRWVLPLFLCIGLLIPNADARPLGGAASRSRRDAAVRAPRTPQRTLTANAGELGKQRLPEELLTQTWFHVELLTPHLHAEISAAPDLYPIEETLRLRVTSTAPGWRMQIKATHLTRKDSKPPERIEADEVHAAVPGGEWTPIQQPMQVVHQGPAGESVVEISLALQTGEFHAPGTYCGELYITQQHPQGPRSPMIKVPFCVTVGGQVTHSIAGNKIYFHFGNPGESQSASIQGQVQSEIPLALVLTSTSSLDGIPRLKALGDSSGAAAPIPLDLKLRDGSGGNPRPPDEQSNNGQRASWQLRTTPGSANYQIECEVRPEAYQPPGDYGMEITVSLAPVL